MDYTLDSYGSFDAEQKILLIASKKKRELEKQKELKETEILYRCNIIKGYFIRLSWIHKKQYILSILREISCFNTLLKIVNYISTLHGKMAAYTEVSPNVRHISQQVLLDHDRTLDKNYLKEIACADLNWISTLNASRQMDIVTDLLALSGGGLIRKIYIPLVSIYNRKLLADTKMKEETGHMFTGAYLDDLFNDKYFDDSEKYPQDHPLSVEVEKMRRKWNEIIEKSRNDVFASSTAHTKEKVIKKAVESENNKNSNKKSAAKEKPTKKKETKKGGRATQGDTVDWIQVLPIWIVKQIFDYLDIKTLQNLRKINPYWSYAIESILKERQARIFLDESIKRMRSNVDSEILKEFEENLCFLDESSSPVKKSNSPREKNLKKLINRGAILEQMVPKVEKSQKVQSSLLTTLRMDKKVCAPLDNMTVFPRLIKEDLLLYQSYPCNLKDIQILIDVEGELRRQRKTLSYSLSKELSDTFSVNEANLADW